MMEARLQNRLDKAEEENRQLRLEIGQMSGVIETQYAAIHTAKESLATTQANRQQALEVANLAAAKSKLSKQASTSFQIQLTQAQRRNTAAMQRIQHKLDECSEHDEQVTIEAHMQREARQSITQFAIEAVEERDLAYVTYRDVRAVLGETNPARISQWMPELPPLEELSQEMIDLIREGECPSERSDHECSGTHSHEAPPDAATPQKSEPQSETDSNGHLTEPDGVD
jgi:hypothetical protein